MKDYKTKTKKKSSMLLRGVEWLIVALIVLFCLLCIVNVAKSAVERADIGRCEKWQRYEQDFKGFELGSLEKAFCLDLGIIIE
jgi:hypothetical protein